jgi:hypothetical protein
MDNLASVVLAHWIIGVGCAGRAVSTLPAPTVRPVPDRCRSSPRSRSSLPDGSTNEIPHSQFTKLQFGSSSLVMTCYSTLPTGHPLVHTQHRHGSLHVTIRTRGGRRSGGEDLLEVTESVYAHRAQATCTRGPNPYPYMGGWCSHCSAPPRAGNPVSIASRIVAAGSVAARRCIPTVPRSTWQPRHTGRVK